MSDGNKYLLKRLAGIQQVLIAQYAASAQLPAASKGAEREVFLREFLQRVYPAHRRFTTGAITDSYGTISGQVDVAVEYGMVPSFPLSLTDERLMIAECVGAAIEVKSNLSHQWTEVERTTASIKQLKRRYVYHLTHGDPGPTEDIPVLAVGYTGYGSIDALRKRWESTDEAARPDGLLVIDQALCIYDGRLIMSKLQGEEHWGTGPYAFFRFLMALQQRLMTAVVLSPDYNAYMGLDQGTGERNQT